jgi:Periplasmic component of the Tol biopolymer transport system
MRISSNDISSRIRRTALAKLATAGLLLAVLFAAGCSSDCVHEGRSLIWPDYADVTIPCNIAPLNFCYNGEGHKNVTTSFAVGGETLVEKKGAIVKFSSEEWRMMLEKAAGGDICVTNSLGDGWVWHVSEDAVDPYLTYRLIEPGYEVWHEVEIRERDVTSFDERIISDFRHTGNSCMNCHIHAADGRGTSMMYVRGPKGGAILARDGKVRKLNLKADGMISSTVYGGLHPDSRYGVFSTNIIIPGFHSMASGRLEVFDTASDIVVVDFDHNKIIQPASLNRADKLETFPTFSADGRKIYFCSADTVALPSKVKELHYDLLEVDFDPEKCIVGTTVDTLRSAARCGGSVCHPKVSPDGRWLLYTVADYGTFPICHEECDLEMMDLSSGATVLLEGVNDFRSDTYHSWSSDSRWFVFASKRGDGQYGKPYFCHVDPDGTVSKPFVLPQEDPLFYDGFLKSFNIPDLGRVPVCFDAESVGALLEEPAEIFGDHTERH